MSGNRYISEPYSELTFKRIKPASDAVEMEGFNKVLSEAIEAGLPEHVLTYLREEKSNAESNTVGLSRAEVTALDSKIKQFSLGYYGVQVNSDGIVFEGTQEGNLYGFDEELEELLSVVKDTVLFSGTVEIWAVDIDEYERFEVVDSKIARKQSAKLHWV